MGTQRQLINNPGRAGQPKIQSVVQVEQNSYKQSLLLKEYIGNPCPIKNINYPIKGYREAKCQDKPKAKNN